jgi:hypothetical protein
MAFGNFGGAKTLAAVGTTPLEEKLLDDSTEFYVIIWSTPLGLV